MLNATDGKGAVTTCQYTIYGKLEKVTNAIAGAKGRLNMKIYNDKIAEKSTIIII